MKEQGTLHAIIYVVTVIDAIFSIKAKTVWATMEVTDALKSQRCEIHEDFFFIHSSVHGHLSFFHILAIVNNAVIHIRVHTSFKINFFPLRINIQKWNSWIMYCTVLSSQSCLTLCDLEVCNLPGTSVHGNSPGKNTGVGCYALLRGSSQPRDWTQVSHIASIFFLPSEPPGNPMNTGVGSLSLLRGIFPTQESNQGLLHCRQILYQLSY